MMATILPVPRRQTLHSGCYRVTEPITISLAADLHRDSIGAFRRFADALPIAASVAAPSGGGSPAGIVLTTHPDLGCDESYRLDITQQRVTVAGAGAPGLFYGLQTLLQIAAAEGSTWRCRTIEDAPQLRVRGLSLDVSRGKVPTRATLERLIDRIAALKINHLQLYVEHTFDFAFDPDIARDCSPLTADDITALDAYCRDRHVDFVPSLACFGHMGRILSLPRYRHLAEIPARSDWESQTWHERLRGLTINARDLEARQMLQTMLDEFLPLFAGGFANIGADETHDLGRGANEEYCRRAGRGRLYVDHLNFLADLCRRHGKRMMFWGDIIRSFPHLIDELPEDVVLLDWGYEADSAFPAAGHLARRNRDVYVCPGTTGWKRLMNAMGTAGVNIAAAAKAAQQHDATGMVVADWGDHGHFNMLACSFPAIAHAASLAWNPAPLDTASLDAAVDAILCGRPQTGCMPALRNVARAGETVETWPALYDDLAASAKSAPMGVDQAYALKADVHAALPLVSQMRDEQDRHEWQLACRASALLADKTLMLRSLSRRDPERATALRRFADDVDAFSADYATAWHAYNRPCRLLETTAVLDRIARRTRSLIAS